MTSCLFEVLWFRLETVLDCLSKPIHLSHDIVNELRNLIEQRVLRLVLDKFSSSRAISKYSILADETREASICLRRVDR